MIVQWLPTEVFAGRADHYLVSWRRNGSDTFRKIQVAASPFIHDFASKNTFFTFY